MFRPVIVSFHKPRWFVVSKQDKHNRTIYEILPKSWKEDFYYIWRLDKDSRWLLLLTNVPELVNEIEHPSRNIFKIYEVQIDKSLKKNLIQRFKKWILVTESWEFVQNPKSSKREWEEIDSLQMYDVTPFSDKKWKYFLRVLLTYWKKRHIRRMLKAFWYNVLDLRRIKFWKYELWNIKKWQYKIHPIKIRPWKKTNFI